MQLLLFIISIAVGSRMIYQFNHASWLVNMRQVSCSCLERVRRTATANSYLCLQCPPLATIWIYTIIQLELIPAFLNLVVVGGFVWWKNLKILQ
jgi:hypothetical protein